MSDEPVSREEVPGRSLGPACLYVVQELSYGCVLHLLYAAWCMFANHQRLCHLLSGGLGRAARICRLADGEVQRHRHLHLPDERDTLYPPHSLLPEPFRYQESYADVYACMGFPLWLLCHRQSGIGLRVHHSLNDSLRYCFRFLQYLRLSVR